MDVGLLVICNRVGMPVMLIVNVFMQMRNGFMGVEMAVLFPVKHKPSLFLFKEDYEKNKKGVLAVYNVLNV